MPHLGATKFCAHYLGVSTSLWPFTHFLGQALGEHYWQYLAEFVVVFGRTAPFPHDDEACLAFAYQGQDFLYGGIYFPVGSFFEVAKVYGLYFAHLRAILACFRYINDVFSRELCRFRRESAGIPGWTFPFSRLFL